MGEVMIKDLRNKKVLRISKSNTKNFYFKYLRKNIYPLANNAIN